ncbi:MAG: TerC family protein [Planctomycetaceae bacterium]|nr:TerC family protein [Planctomycetaceae bacterium]
MPEFIIPLLALTAMEIVLGIDNIVFIAILTGRLPATKQALGRNLGLIIALATRVALLSVLYWINTGDVFEGAIFELESLHIDVHGVFNAISNGEIRLLDDDFARMNEITAKDIIMFLGGIFLIGKSVHEIHQKFSDSDTSQPSNKKVTFGAVLLQVALLDIVFSLDSVITAVGMARQLWVMITAMVIAMLVMLIFAKRIADFIESNPTLKMLALSFLILIGVMLVAESMGTHFNKGYIYFAMAFSLGVEFLNLRLHNKKKSKLARAAENTN